MQTTLEGVLDPSSGQAPRDSTTGVDADVQVSNAGYCCNAYGIVVARTIDAVVVWRRLRVLEVSTTIPRIISGSCSGGRRDCHADRHQGGLNSGRACRTTLNVWRARGDGGNISTVDG
jgi:hypothetical protein